MEREDEERGRAEGGGEECSCPPVGGVLCSSHLTSQCVSPVGDPLVQMVESVSRETLDHYFEADKLRTVRRRRA